MSVCIKFCFPQRVAVKSFLKKNSTTIIQPNGGSVVVNMATSHIQAFYLWEYCSWPYPKLFLLSCRLLWNAHSLSEWLQTDQGFNLIWLNLTKFGESISSAKLSISKKTIKQYLRFIITIWYYSDGMVTSWFPGFILLKYYGTKISKKPPNPFKIS